MLLEGWKQIADALGYSVRQTYRFYEDVKREIHLRHYLGAGHRMRMDNEDLANFKTLILQRAVRFFRDRPPAARLMAENGMICQTKLFD